MKITKIIVGITFSIFWLNTLSVQTNTLEATKIEIEEAIFEEQKVFKNGDCNKVLDMMDDNITF